MKYAEIKDLDKKTLQSKITEKKKEVFELKMQKHTSGLEKAHLLKNAKKDVAQYLTALSSKK